MTADGRKLHRRKDQIDIVDRAARNERHGAIRALQQLEGIELMKKRRAPDGRGIDEHDLCRGPGNLTKALGITIKDNRLDLVASTLTIEDRGISVAAVATGPRIGIRVAVERPWRYWVEGHRSVSVHRSSTTKVTKITKTTK